MSYFLKRKLHTSSFLAAWDIAQKEPAPFFYPDRLGNWPKGAGDSSSALTAWDIAQKVLETLPLPLPLGILLKRCWRLFLCPDRLGYCPKGAGDSSSALTPWDIAQKVPAILPLP